MEHSSGRPVVRDSGLPVFYRRIRIRLTSHNRLGFEQGGDVADPALGQE